MINENLINKFIKNLGVTREEAIQLIKDDEAIDKMTSSKEIDSDLSEAQKKAKKKATQADRKPTVYKFDTTKRKRAENTDKRFLINTIQTALESAECTDIEITNVEREIIFFSNGTKYKITLSAPRS